MERLQLVNGPWPAIAGTTSVGSPVVTGLSSTARLAPGQRVRGAGVPSSTLIASVDSDTQVTLTKNATRAGTPSLTFLLEPVLLDEAKLHLRVDFPDDDPKIARLISSARSVCETRLGQGLITQTVALHLDEFPWGGGYLNRNIRRLGPSVPYWLPSVTNPIDLITGPVQSIVSVQYYDNNNTLQTIDPSLYEFEQGTPARVSPVFGQTWPVPQPRIGAVIFTYVIGFGDTADDVPEPVKDAMLLLIGTAYENRETVATNGTVSSISDVLDDLLATADNGEYC